MVTFQAILLALFPAVVLSGTYEATTENNNVLVRDSFRVIAASNLNFTNALYQVLSRETGNVFFSPLSIQMVLALAAQGAGGRTLQEMITGLRLPQDQQITRDGFRQILSAIRKIDSESVKIANKIYTDRRFSPTEEFSRIAQGSFQSDGEKVEFNRNAEQARLTINQWVESNTANKIKDMLPEGSISHDTAMVLVNAVYFKGTWKVQFNPEQTKRKPFFVRQGVQPMVEMMHVTDGENFYFKEVPEIKARILAMPYTGESMNFVIILPNEKFGLREVESRLVGVDLGKLFKEMRTPEVRLQMPRFKMQYSIELNNALNQLGMRQMFSNSANFSGLATGTGGVKVSKVAHKSYIDVNEEGTEAAATTSITSVLLSAVPDEPEVVHFVVDRPFLYFLRHERTGSVLFMGRYIKPT